MSDLNPLQVILDKHISHDQYKLIEDYKRISQSLEKQHSKTKSKSQKVDELKKKLSCLQFMTKNAEKESMRYQSKLEKLQTTQNYATQLLKLKYQSFVETENDQTTKHKECATKRQTLWRNIHFSQSVHDRMKHERIQRIRQEEQRVSSQYRRKSSEIESFRRQQKQQVKAHQIMLKDRKKRYQLFKLQQASLNYSEKMQNQLRVFKQKNRYLHDLKSKFQKEEQIFRKTQILSKQTAKIQSIYLTGSQN